MSVPESIERSANINQLSINFKSRRRLDCHDEFAMNFERCSTSSRL
jgi:hypothetical protein